METYEKLCWILVGWTLVEGTLVATWPSGMVRLTQVLFRKWGSYLTTLEHRDLRKIGLVEVSFGLLLGGYLLLAT